MRPAQGMHVARVGVPADLHHAEAWAHEVRRLLDEDYPTARKVRLVCDTLNTHSIASL